MPFVFMIWAKADTHPPTREQRRVRTHWGRSPPAAAETEVRPGFQDQRQRDSWQQPHPRGHTHRSHTPAPPISASNPRAQLPTPEKTLLDLLPGPQTTLSPPAPPPPVANPGKTTRSRGPGAHARLTRNLLSSRLSTCRVVMVLLTLTLVTDPYAGVNTEVCTGRGRSRQGSGPGRTSATCRGARSSRRTGLWEHRRLISHTDPRTSRAHAWHTREAGTVHV